MMGWRFGFLLSLDYKSNVHSLLFRPWRVMNGVATKQKVFDTGEKVFLLQIFLSQILLVESP